MCIFFNFASSEENKDYCKMQIRSNLSEILRCSICSVGGICCNQLDQSALHWETSEFKHILKFLNPGKISQSFKTAKCCRNNILSKFKLRVILGGKCGEKDKLQVIQRLIWILSFWPMVSEVVSLSVSTKCPQKFPSGAYLLVREKCIFFGCSCKLK